MAKTGQSQNSPTNHRSATPREQIDRSEDMRRIVLFATSSFIPLQIVFFHEGERRGDWTGAKRKRHTLRKKAN
jgi:hypothetical protein